MQKSAYRIPRKDSEQTGQPMRNLFRAIVLLVILLSLMSLETVGGGSHSMSVDSSLSLEYEVTIESPHTGDIHVSIKASQVREERLMLGRGETGGLPPRKIPAARDLIATDQDGSLLDWAFSGSSSRFIETLVVIRRGPVVLLEYDADLSPVGDEDMNWYLGPNFGVVEPEYLFLFPIDASRESYLPVSGVRTKFILPDGWTVATHWTRVGDYYEARTSDDFLWGSLGFGQFEYQRRQISNVEVTVAFYGFTAAVQQTVSRDVFRIYEYFSKMVGDVSLTKTMPRNKYLLIFVPRIQGRQIFSNREGAYGYFAYCEYPYPEQYPPRSHLFWIAWQAHMIFHEWNPSAFFGLPIWFSEGVTSYYEFASPRDLQLISRRQFEYALVDRFQWYRSEILGTAFDVSLEYASAHPWSDERVLRLNYFKGCLLAYMLDEKIRELTNSTKTLGDVMKYLYENYAIKGKPLSTASILRALNDATGFDFASFFQMYILGTAKLPLSLTAGRLEIIQTEMPTVNRLPIDSDMDGLTDDEERTYGTNPNNRDTDDDERLDGEEVHGFRAIFIDGSKGDWDGMKPLWVDEANDYKYKVPSSDLKSLTMSYDGGSLYFMIELHDGKPNPEDSYDIMFDLDSDQMPDYTFNCYPKGFVNAWNLTGIGQYVESNLIENPAGAEISSDDVVELKIPLNLVGNTRVFLLASHIFVSSVQTENDMFLPRWVSISLDALFPQQKTDPLNPDTDGDSIKDGVDPHPLDPKPETPPLTTATASTTLRTEVSTQPEQTDWVKVNWIYFAGLIVFLVIVVPLIVRKIRRTE
jgi:hypothetical protein